MAKRRPQGDGMVRKRSDGRWEARIVIGHKNDGTPMHKSVFGKTQKETLDKLHRAIETYRGVDRCEDSRMTLGEWLDKWLDEHIPADKLQSLIVAFSVVLSIGLMLMLFMLLPTFIAGLFHATSPAVHNLIEGVVKIAVLLTYMILCSKQKDVYRVFCYHGAEHKTIFCYEAGLPLTVENARVQPRHHPRCGTSFLFVVIVVSILFSSIAFTQVEWQNLWVRIGVHLLMLIPIVGLTYEFNRFVGRHDNAVTRVLSAPGMWLQNFTTFEPDDSMLEVAIESLKLVLPQEQGKDKW